MSEFNFDAFRPVRVTNTEEKRVQVAQASEAKKAQLATKTNSSWVDNLGLEPGSFIGNRVNDVASLVSGTGRMAGDIATLPMNLFASLETAGASASDYEAFARVQAGSKDPYDLKQAKQFQNAEYLRGMAKTARDTLDVSSVVDQTNRNALASDLGNEFESNWGKVTAGWKDGKPSDVVAGVAGLLKNAGQAVITNPSAAREYIIENAPQLLTGAAGKAGQVVMTASNLGYAADNYRTGLEEYAKNNNGALPSEKDRTRMALLAASLAAAEQAGDMFGLSVGKVKAAGKLVSGVADGTAEAATKTGLRQSIKNSLIAGAEGGAEETATEGYQTWAEGEVNQKPASAKDIYTGAVIGGVAGAGLSGGLRAAAEATKSTPEHVAERVQVEADVAAEKAALEKAVAEKTPDVFLDKKSGNYSPSKAIAVLQELSKQADAAPEQIKENLKKSGEVINYLEESKAKLESLVDPQAASKVQAEIAKIEEELKAVDPKDTEMIAATNEELDFLREDLARLNDKEQLLANQNRLSEIDRQLADAREVHHSFISMTNPVPTKAEIDKHVADANSTDKQVASKAGEALLNLSMTAPDELDPTVLQTLVKNTNNGLTAQQRLMLRKFSVARVAELQLKNQRDVSQEILFGQKTPNGNIGIAQYRARIAAALASDNKQSAQRNLNMLGKFAASHAAKLEAIAKADVGDQIVRQGDAWVVNTGKRLSNKERVSNGAFNVLPNSTKVIGEIRNEVKALNAAHAQLKASVDLHFGAGVVQSEPSRKAQAVSQNNSSKKMVKVAARLNDKPVQTAAKTPQNEVKAEQKTAKTSVDTASPSSQPSGPVAANAAPATVASSAPAAKPKKELWNGVLVDPSGFDGIPAGQAVIAHDKKTDMYSIHHVTKDGVRVTGNYWFNPAEDWIEDFNITSDKGDHSVGRAVLHDILKGILKEHPSAMGLSGIRITGVRRNDGKHASMVNFLIKNGKLVQDTRQRNAQPEAAKQQAVRSEASTAPVANAATAESENTQLADAGKLSVMASRIETKPDTSMQELFANPDMNPIAQFFKQKAKADVTGFHRPLVAARDFLSAWLGKKIVTPSDFLGFAVSNKQKVALTDFAKKAKVWNGVLAANLAAYEKNDSFKLRDMMQYLLTKDGGKVSVDENVLTAMSYGMYSWLVNESTNTGKTDEQLNKMHGRDADAEFDSRVYDLLDGVSNIEDTLAADLGNKAIQALGLTVGANAPKDLMPRLKTALGTHMLIALASKDIGLVRRKPINTKEINDLFAPNGVVIDSKKNTMYVFADRDQLAHFKEANTGTEGIVDTLFGSEDVSKLASTKPSKFSQKYAQHTRQKVPAMPAKVLNEAQHVPHTVIPDMWALMGAIGRDNVLKVAGYKDVAKDFVHAVHAKGVETKNRGLVNQLDMALDMLGADDVGDVHADITIPRYVKYEVWKNFRVGVITESLNQQASKIHRYMFARPSWTNKIDLNNDEHVSALKVAIAAAIGIKTDDQPNEDTVNLLDKRWIEDADLRKAVEAVHNGLTANQWENTDLIAKYAAGAEGMQTLQALVAYSKLMYAQSDFIEVTMLVGADGKTNGPILTQLALGAAHDSNSLMDRMARGGIYGSADGQPKFYAQWRKETKGKDLYQDLAAYLLTKIDMNDQFRAMEAILGTMLNDDQEVTKEGRDLVKTPLTAFAFGSSLRGSVAAMEKKFIDSIYKKIEKMAKAEANAKTDAERAAVKATVTGFVQALNTLVKSQNPSFDDVRVDSAQAMLGHALDAQIEDNLRAAFRAIMAVPVQQAMETYFATFIERRGDLNRTVQAGFAMYQVAYKAAREKAIQQLIAEDHIAWRKQTGGAEQDKGRKLALTDLTSEQEDAVREKLVNMLPITHTAYSMGGDLSSGIYMGKAESQLSSDPLLQSQITLASPVINGKAKADGGFNESKTVHMKGVTRVETNPGVAGTPYLIHSLDSFLMHSALADVQEALNVHDEIGHGVLEVNKAAGAINRATINALAKFSPAREAMNMLERIAIDMAKRIQAGEMSKDDVDAVIGQWKQIYGAREQIKKTARQNLPVNKVVNGIRAMAVANAVNADRVRLSTVAKVGVVDQYTWETGQYQVPKSVREQALADAKAVVTTMSDEANKAFDTIAAFASGKAVDMVSMEDADPAPTMKVEGADMATVADELGQPTNADRIEQVAQTMAALPGTGLNVWGEIGPSTMVDSKVAAAFQAKPVMSRNEVVAMLKPQLNGAAYAVLEQAAKVLPENLKVMMVTPDTSAKDVLEKPMTKSRGWFVPTKDGSNEIYLLSADFRYSGMNTETVLHELVHAALAREVHTPTSKASASLVSDLEALRAHVKQLDGATKFADATKDVHEFLAWGLSNAEFQKFLSGVEYTKPKTTRNKLVTAMRAFTKLVSELFFGNSNSNKERAMSVLLHNAAGLFAAAAEPRKGIMHDVLTHAVPAQSYTTAEIYEALGQNANNPLSQHDDSRLRYLLGRMVETLSPIYGAFGKEMMTSTMGAASVWANAQVSGAAPFALDAVAHGLAGNEQVAFMLEQVEATVRAAISGADGATSVAYKELTKLYDEARETLKASVGAGLTQDEYDFLFKMESGADNHSVYLSRFASLGLVSPKINALLSFQTSKHVDEKESDSFLGRLQQTFEKIMEWVAGRWTKTYGGQQADSKLDALATQLVMIEAKRRARLNVEASATLQAIENVMGTLVDGVKNKVVEATNSEFIKKSKNGYVRLLGSMTSAAVNERMNQVAQAWQDFSDTHYHYSNGMFSSLVNEIRGSHKGNLVFLKLLRAAKLFEGNRKDLITGTAKVALQSFANNGKDLTNEMKASISNVFLRTDMAVLLDTYEMGQLQDMLNDRSKLSEAIVNTTEELASATNRMYYINAAKALGYKMVTGKARMGNTLHNAHSIVRLYGTGQAVPSADVIEKFEPVIDRLASLYALHYTKSNQMDAARDVINSEMKRDEGNGVEMILKMHQKLQKDSRERLFKEQEALMTKGYLPEIYNPFIEAVSVPADQAEAMKELGFGKPYALKKAKADINQTKMVLMARHGSGLQQHITGTMSLTSMSTKGTTIHNGQTDLFSQQGQFNAVMMDTVNNRVQHDVNQMFSGPIEPDQVEAEYLVPVLNPRGDKVNYRYMMAEATKNDVLDRDNRFDKLLGAFAGSIYDKEITPKQNRTVVEALHEQYQQEYAQRPRSFIEVGPRSPDPEMREIYRLLPESTKQAIREVWKSDSMRVRIDLLDLNFGYRKLSMADVLQTDRDARKGFDKFMGEVLGFVFTGKLLSEYADPKDSAARDAKATVRIHHFEEIWQTLVREAKDILVVKSLSTLIGNMTSNLSLLYGYGVPVTDMIRQHRIAFRGAVAYKRDSDELFALQTKLDTGTSGNVAQDKARVVQLKDALAKNPVRELIEAGLMPTIVDDVEIDDDIYSFKSKFVKRVEDSTKWINPEVKAVAKNLYMSHDTKLYKTLSQAAQLSDFLGRYTLYQHMTTRKNNPMSKEDAIQLASDAFINYDVPTHRKMQYMNDMGVLRFTKYYLRIQKVIMHLHKENPGRLMALIGMSAYFNHVPTLMDSSMVNRFGNPIEMGAFTYPQALGTLPTLRAVEAVLK